MSKQAKAITTRLNQLAGVKEPEGRNEFKAQETETTREERGATYSTEAFDEAFTYILDKYGMNSAEMYVFNWLDEGNNPDEAIEYARKLDYDIED